MNLSSGYPFWLVRYGLPFSLKAAEIIEDLITGRRNNDEAEEDSKRKK